MRERQLHESCVLCYRDVGDSLSNPQFRPSQRMLSKLDFRPHTKLYPVLFKFIQSHVSVP